MIRISQVVCLLVASLLWTAEVTAGPASKAGNRAPRAATGLESDDPSVRRQAITKLIADRDPSAVAQLSLALESDDDESVRREAAAGLGDLGDKRGTTALKRCLQVEPSETVKRSCRVSLASLDPATTTAASSPPASAPAGGAAPEPSTTPTTSPRDGHTDPTGTTSPRQQFDLRIDVTAEDAAARPNHVYLDLVSAVDKSTLMVARRPLMNARRPLASPPTGIDDRPFGQSGGLPPPRLGWSRRAARGSERPCRVEGSRPADERRRARMRSRGRTATRWRSPGRQTRRSTRSLAPARRSVLVMGRIACEPNTEGTDMKTRKLQIVTLLAATALFQQSSAPAAGHRLPRRREVVPHRPAS